MEISAAPQERASVSRAERRKALTRGALLAAARRLFAAGSVESTTIAEIAEAADVAVGSFYNYFSTKEELFAALIETVLTEQRAAIEERQALVDDPAEMISVAHRHLVDLASRDSDLGWLLVRSEISYSIAKAVLWPSASSDLAAGVAAGRFTVEDPELALIASGGALLAVIHAILSGDLSADVGSAHAAVVLRAFGMDPTEAAEVARRAMPEHRSVGTDRTR